MDEHDLSLIERLKFLQEEYIRVKEINASYETMFQKFKDYHTRVKNKIRDYTETFMLQNKTLKKAIVDEKNKFEQERDDLSAEIVILNEENDRYKMKIQELEKTIKQQKCKVTNLQKDLEIQETANKELQSKTAQLGSFQNSHQEEVTKLKKELESTKYALEIQEIANKELQCKIVQLESIQNLHQESVYQKSVYEKADDTIYMDCDNDQSYNKNVPEKNEVQNLTHESNVFTQYNVQNEMSNNFIERSKHLERLEYLQELHKKESDKQEKEIKRLQRLLKESNLPKSYFKSKNIAAPTPHKIHKYPELSGISTKSASRTTESKKRKLHTDDLYDIKDII